MALWELYQLNKLMRNQWLKTAGIEAIQQRKLKKLLKHAYDNVSYYRQLFDSVRVKPEEIRTVGDLQKIPVTTKSHLRKLSLDQVIAKGIDINKCVKKRNTGTTGIPLDFFFTKKDLGLRPLLDLRMLYACGYKLTDKIVALINLGQFKKQWFQYLGIMRKEYIFTFDIPEEKQIEDIQRINPDVIWSVSSNILLLADMIKRHKIKKIQPRLIFTMGELLTQKDKKLIVSVFGIEPFDCYGLVESGFVAWQCARRSGYHINTDSVVMEFIKDGRQAQPGEAGELVITNLHSYAMPFIRYSVGDTGILNDRLCLCGRDLPLMSIIEGRTVDFIVLPDGKKISPYRLTCALEEIPEVVRFQIIQEEIDKIVVKFIKGEGYSLSQTIGKIEEKYKALLGDNVKIEPVAVDSLLNERSGKFRIVISKPAAGLRREKIEPEC